MKNTFSLLVLLALVTSNALANPRWFSSGKQGTGPGPATPATPAAPGTPQDAEAQTVGYFSSIGDYPPNVIATPHYAVFNKDTNSWNFAVDGRAIARATPGKWFKRGLKVVKWTFSIKTEAEKNHVDDIMTYFLSWPQANIEITGITSNVRKEGYQQTWTSIKSDHDGIIAPQTAVLPGDVPEGAHVSYQFLDSKKAPIGSLSEVITAKNSGWGVVSDIDDTIKHTGCLSKSESFINTFAKEFHEIPGMPGFYQHLSTVLNTLPQQKGSFGFAPPTSNVLFTYLSASPIFIADPLTAFIKKAGFPTGALILENALIYNPLEMSRIRDLLTYKVDKAQQLLKDFSEKNWVFVGDSGQMDPAVYANLYLQLSKNPNKKICIYIRAVSGVQKDKEAIRNDPRRFMTDFRGVPPAKWVVFDKPSDLDGVDPNKDCYPPGKSNPIPEEAAKLAVQDAIQEAALQEMRENQWSSILKVLHIK